MQEVPRSTWKGRQEVQTGGLRACGRRGRPQARVESNMRANKPPSCNFTCRGGKAHAALRAKSSVSALAPITKEDMVQYIASGCKPREQWRMGTEHEKFGFHLDTLKSVNHEDIDKIFSKLSDRFGWEKVYEGDVVIALKLEGQSITLEPGGQFELSGAPVDSIHKTCAELNSHLYQVKMVTEELGFGFLGAGFQPKWKVNELPMMPKERYNIMRNHMPKVGSLGLDMMFRTCTVQVNLDYESEKDMVEKFRIGLALQPISTALFANSPFKDGKPNGYVSYRSHIWTDVDNSRCGMLPFVFDEDFGFEKYVDYMLDVPMYFVYRDGKYINAAGQSFRDFMEGKLPALPGEYPTIKDWEDQLSVAFPEVRLKKFLEMRGADGGPWRRICALPALWVGLLYDTQAQQEALDYIQDWTLDELAMLREEVPRTGFNTPFRGRKVLDVARDVLKIAHGGLSRRGKDEGSFLRTLDDIVASGKTPADILLDRYYGRWEQNVDKIFIEEIY